MRTHVLAVCLAAGLLLGLPSTGLTAGTPPDPPTVTGLCATDNDYLWTISSTAAAPSSLDIEYRASFADWLPAVLAPGEGSGHSVVVATSRDAGTTLSARWTAYPDELGTGSAPSTPCETAALTVTIVVEGGTGTPSAFDATVTGSTPNPPWSTRAVVHVVSGTPLTLDAGNYVVAPKRTDLPPGYFWRSTSCGTGMTDDPAYPRLIEWLLPGTTESCTVVFHYGPILADSIAAGKNTGFDGFGSSALVVPSGTWVTYLVRTQPSLAGLPLQVWRRVGKGAWTLAATRTVAADGSIHFYAKVTAATAFQARWPGDATYPASSAPGRRASASTGAASLAVTCEEFSRAMGEDGTSTVRREAWVKSGAKITATLCENASTGFSWGSPGYDHRLISLVGHRSVGAPGGAVGGAGTAAWTFKSLKVGTSTITLEYARPWAGGEQHIWNLELVVHATK
jgi:predicted secreted protein